jgi:hypothetical protein
MDLQTAKQIVDSLEDINCRIFALLEPDASRSVGSAVSGILGLVLRSSIGLGWH